MNILIIDDSKERIKLFKKIYFAHTLHISENEKEIENLLFSNFFDLIHLDYDLTEGTSEKIAKTIEANNNSFLIIHSDNRIGVKILKNILPLALVLPFSEFDKKSDKMSKYKSVVANNSTFTIEQFKNIFEN